MLAAVLALVSAVVLFYVVVEFFVLYTKATGTVWQRALAATRESATILWARAVMFLASLSSLIVEAGSVLGMPEIADAIKSVLSPQGMAILMIVVAIVSERARRRSL